MNKKNKKISIIIIGFGSVGKRHYKNLKAMGFNRISVYDPDDQVFRNGIVQRIEKLDHEALKNFQVAFICSPNHLHIKHALACAKAGCQLFIEKPLSHNLAGIKRLRALARKNKLITMVGCNMRFHPCLIFIKKYLEKNKFGRVYNIFHEFGYYLPDWRPGQDYKKNYAAKRATGGGIILEDIHEFDLLFWLNNFNGVKKEKFLFNRAGNLGIETEDNCLAIFEFKNKVLGLVKCDYLQRSYARSLKIVGENGNLSWNFKENIVWLEAKDSRKNIFQIKNFDFNRAYVDEIRYFFGCLENSQTADNNADMAEKVLRHCIKRK